MCHGDAARYHDWDFRSLLRIKLFDSKEGGGSIQTTARAHAELHPA